ncbi:MAG: hypothetical protein M3R13_09110 [Armatimonadota bacterium]|nr:hypothetical protein [Armatimonadota bacterium]
MAVSAFLGLAAAFLYSLLSGDIGLPISVFLPIAICVTYLVWPNEKSAEQKVPENVKHIGDWLLLHGFENYKVNVIPLQFSDARETTIRRRTLEIPELLAERLSPNALLWSCKADMNALRSSKKPTLYTIFACLPIVVAFPLLDRYDVSWHYWLVAALLFTLSVALGAWLSYRNQLEADTVVTRTAEDLAAAKEALSFAYFSSDDNTFERHFPGFLGEIGGRAKALGIELERDYRAE